MPAEPTKAKLKRRTSRKDLEEYRYDGAHGRELELKRNRGAYSTRAYRRPADVLFPLYIFQARCVRHGFSLTVSGAH